MVIPFKICRIFMWIVVSLVVLLTLSSLTTGIIVLTNDIQSGALYKLYQLFNLDFERNLPTWFTASLLTFIALILLLVTYFSKVLNRPHVTHWLFLSVMFFGLSIDEYVQGHEQIIRPTREMLNTDGFLYNAWIIPAAVLVLIVGMLYLRFMFSLPPLTRKLFFIAGFMYVGAALGAEAIGGYYFSQLGEDYNIGYLIITNIEEMLEMTGLTIFLYGLFQYISMMPLAVEAQMSRPAKNWDQAGITTPLLQNDRI